MHLTSHSKTAIETDGTQNFPKKRHVVPDGVRMSLRALIAATRKTFYFPAPASFQYWKRHQKHSLLP